MIKINTFYLKQGQTSILKKIKIKNNICEIKTKLNSEVKIKRIIERMIQYQIKYVILSNELKQNHKFVENLNNNGIKIFDGKWLYKYLLCDIIEYINNKVKLENNYEIAILANDLPEEISEIIKELSLKHKKIKIATYHFEKFKKTEEKLYENTGFPLIITSNKKKSLSKTPIIINFDLDEEKINKFNIYENAIIINLNKKIKIHKKRYNGMIIGDYEIADNSKQVIESKIFFQSLAEIKMEEVNLSRYEIIRRIIKQNNIKIKWLIGEKQKL